MDSFYFYLILSGAIGPLVIILITYNFAGWNWKKKPWIPFVLGLIFLSITFATNYFFSSTSEELNSTLKNITSPSVYLFLQLNAKADNVIARMYELINIPLGVSLIAAALIYKADLEFDRRLKQYNRGLEDISKSEDTLTVDIKLFEERLNNGDRGADFLEAYQRIKESRLHIKMLRRMLQRKFDDFIEER
ncbi:hypothetical protein [Solimicrobium silvestre]|uniref:Uncharacterized protein n=1 Tax=Solimicrobium silvestre TaxID=2099400 RepID=A0A2S9GT41_9BURK|nr:hypothetical protein [Solimicrobium silvestre]PRC90889.1 hypothetical protein S2091_4382 [Solimicrobium silvestre]